MASLQTCDLDEGGSLGTCAKADNKGHLFPFCRIVAAGITYLCKPVKTWTDPNHQFLVLKNDGPKARAMLESALKQNCGLDYKRGNMKCNTGFTSVTLDGIFESWADSEPSTK
jgi:hypothetical protein